MSRVELVTSFSAAGAELYGLRCVESASDRWPHPLTVYTDEPTVLEGVETRVTIDIAGWPETKASLPWMRPDASKPTNYIWDAKRFAVKAFVWHDAAVRLEQGILVWLDGDTVTTKEVPDGLIDGLMDGVDVAYLGRGSMHPENGFVAFRIPEALPLLAFCRLAYASGAFRELADGWTDCHLLRAGLKVLGVRARDLTSHTFEGEWRSSVDAMALSPLGSYVTHLKGPKRKREAA